MVVASLRHAAWRRTLRTSETVPSECLRTVSVTLPAVKSGLPCFTGRLPLLQEFQKELSQWRKDPSGSKKKPKYSYKTVEELKAKGRISKKLAAPQKELSQVKVRGGEGGAGKHCHTRVKSITQRSLGSRGVFWACFVLFIIAWR